MMGMRARPDTYFNPRSPCGERRLAAQLGALLLEISIHAPRVGSDRSENSTRSLSHDFNPRSPCGERPWTW